MAVEYSNTKRCSKCGETKPLSEFGKHIKGRDGLSTVCRTCKSILDAEYRANNPEKIKNLRAKYYAENTDKVNAANAKWAAANRDRKKLISAKWQADNREKMKANHAKWRSKNPEKVKARSAAWYAANPEARRIKDHNRRARKFNAGGKLSKGLAEKLFKLQRGKCACCGKPLGDNYHLDHIMPLALGGANEDFNMQLLRSTCNQQKYVKHPVDFMKERGFLL